MASACFGIVRAGSFMLQVISVKRYAALLTKGRKNRIMNM